MTDPQWSRPRDLQMLGSGVAFAAPLGRTLELLVKPFPASPSLLCSRAILRVGSVAVLSVVIASLVADTAFPVLAMAKLIHFVLLLGRLRWGWFLDLLHVWRGLSDKSRGFEIAWLSCQNRSHAQPISMFVSQPMILGWGPKAVGPARPSLVDSIRRRYPPLAQAMKSAPCWPIRLQLSSQGYGLRSIEWPRADRGRVPDRDTERDAKEGLPLDKTGWSRGDSPTGGKK